MATSYKAWGILDHDGYLFYGAESTRLEAIIKHVCNMDADCYDENPNMCRKLGQKRLSKVQKSAWEKAKKRGISAVKVSVQEI